MPGLPEAMTKAPLRTFRPSDLASTYTQPGVQLIRLTHQSRILRVGHGFYVAVPDNAPSGVWLPTIEAVAAGVATAIYGERVPVLMHLTAARLHGAVPRAIANAFVASPRQHAAIPLLPPLHGVITFVTRDVDALDATLTSTELGPVLITTIEQTTLDLAKRPTLGHSAGEARAAIASLLPRCDPDRLRDLAESQRMRATWRRILAEYGRT